MKDYVLGKEDGIPKTPEWQENESNVPKDVRACRNGRWRRPSWVSGVLLYLGRCVQVGDRN